MFDLIKATQSGKNHTRVFNKPRNKDYYVAKDLVCLDYDLLSAEWSMTVNALTFTGKGYQSLKEHLDKLCDESEARNRSKKIEDTRILIVAEPLQYITLLLKDIYSLKEENILVYNNSEGKRIVSEVDTGRIIFRNYRSLTEVKKEETTDTDKTYAECMRKVMSMYDDYNPSQFRYTAASMANKKFYKAIPHSVLMKERGRSCVFKNMRHYNASMTGCKRGYFRTFEVDDARDGITWNIHENVYSFDKKSAYQSKFISDRSFPLGETYLNTHNTLEILSTRMRDHKWFKLVLYTTKNNDFAYNSFMRTFYDERFKAYGIDFWDVKTIRDVGFFDKFLYWLENNTGDWALITSDKTGYMPLVFRERLMNVYLMKDMLQRGDPLRVIVKQMLETLYGKSIQNYDFKTKNEVYEHYAKNAEKFISPNQALHVVSAVRHEIITLIRLLGDDVISYDTDGIKVIGSHPDVFDVVNKTIRERNKAAGFEGSNIGTWQLEFNASRFIQFNTKQYAYDLNHIAGQEPDIHWTMAGLNNESINSFLDDIKGQDPFDYLIENNGYNFKKPSGYRYDKETKTFTKKSGISRIFNPSF